MAEIDPSRNDLVSLVVAKLSRKFEDEDETEFSTSEI
jgi:hypothetical protein